MTTRECAYWSCCVIIRQPTKKDSGLFSLAEYESVLVFVMWYLIGRCQTKYSGQTKPIHAKSNSDRSRRSEKELIFFRLWKRDGWADTAQISNFKYNRKRWHDHHGVLHHPPDQRHWDQWQMCVLNHVMWTYSKSSSISYQEREEADKYVCIYFNIAWYICIIHIEEEA